MDLHGFIGANSGILISVSLVLAVTALVVAVLIIREIRFLRRPFRAMAELLSLIHISEPTRPY